MSDIRLFRLSVDHVEPIVGSAVALEKSLQTLIERHAEPLLGVRFLASEFSTTKSYGGRIDTLGIDESGSPVIIEYKRAINENVINQGLYYLNWLLDHRADFKLLVMEELGAAIAATIEWSAPRLICIASDFTKYDQHAIQQMPGNIDLVRYRRYGDDLLLLEQFASSTAEVSHTRGATKPTTPNIPESNGQDSERNPADFFSGVGGRPAILDKLEQCSPETRDRYETLRSYALGLGDGVYEHIIDRYIAFRALKSFAYVRFRPTLNKIRVDVSLDEATVAAGAGFVHAQGGKGRWPVIEIVSNEDVGRALPLLAQSYQRT